MKRVRIWSFSGPNVGKYIPEKLLIRTLFTQWQHCDFTNDPTFGVLGDECLELIKKTPQFLKKLGDNFKKTLFLE